MKNQLKGLLCMVLCLSLVVGGTALAFGETEPAPVEFFEETTGVPYEFTTGYYTEENTEVPYAFTTEENTEPALVYQGSLGASQACIGHTRGIVNGCPACMEGEKLHICENNFPDANFRGYLIDELLGSELIPVEQVNNQTRISCVLGEISSLKGVEFFGALEELYCNDNQLTSLDVSKNVALEYLNCYFNQLTSLDVSKNVELRYLYCYSNQLTSLDVSKNAELVGLDCTSNQLTSLDVSKNVALKNLSCNDNQLTSLDISNNIALTNLACAVNQLTSLDMSKNVALKSLLCTRNILTSIDVSKNMVLVDLICNGCGLTSLDVSQNLALEELRCSGNGLTSLDVSKNVALEDLNCSSNQLTSLDLSNNQELLQVDCSNQTIIIDNADRNTIDMGQWLDEDELARVSSIEGGTLDDSSAIIELEKPGGILSYVYDTQNDIAGHMNVSVKYKYLKVVLDANGGYFTDSEGKSKTVLEREVESGFQNPIRVRYDTVIFSDGTEQLQGVWISEKIDDFYYSKPKREGFIFRGWTVEETGEVIPEKTYELLPKPLEDNVKFDHPVNCSSYFYPESDVKLKAIWEKAVQVSFIYSVDEKYVDEVEKYSFMQTFHNPDGGIRKVRYPKNREGYQFWGWREINSGYEFMFIGEGIGDFEYFQVLDNMVFEAIWKPLDFISPDENELQNAMELEDPNTDIRMDIKKEEQTPDNDTIKRIEDVIGKEKEELEVIASFDITVYSVKCNESGNVIPNTRERISQLNSSVNLTFTTPNKSGKTYLVVRTHMNKNGELEVTLLPTTDNGDGTVSVKSDKFSLYYLVAVEDKAYIPGDINGDGKVNIFDVIRLLKYVTGENVVTFANTDVNGDGKENIFDVIRLLKYVTGENVEIQ